MKTTLRLIATVALGCGFALEMRSQGYLVPNGVVYVGTSNYVPYEIDVIHDPTNRYYTGFSLYPSGITPPSGYTNTFQFLPILDVGVRVFLVASNDAISLEPIQAGDYTELLFPNTYVFGDGVTFYIGLYTGNVRSFPQDGVYTDPLFGWAQLVNNRGVIEMFDSAIAYQAGGIYAGTRNFFDVPEPHIERLFALSALLLTMHRRHPSTRKE